MKAPDFIHEGTGRVIQEVRITAYRCCEFHESTRWSRDPGDAHCFSLLQIIVAESPFWKLVHPLHDKNIFGCW